MVVNVDLNNSYWRPTNPDLIAKDRVLQAPMMNGTHNYKRFSSIGYRR